MGQPDNAGFTYDYGLLHAAPNCDLPELKRCYRLAVRALHPDRNPDLADDVAAQDALRELTASYRRLLEYHRSYGRLPGEIRRHSAQPTQPAPGGTPTARRRWTPWLASMAIALVAAYHYWPRQVADKALSPGATSTPSASVVPAGGVDPAIRAIAGAAPIAIRIGDTKLRVRKILGSPILGSATAWEYGPSHVLFKDGRVVDWYSSPLKPLPVDEKSRAPGWINPDTE